MRGTFHSQPGPGEDESPLALAALARHAILRGETSKLGPLRSRLAFEGQGEPFYGLFVSSLRAWESWLRGEAGSAMAFALKLRDDARELGHEPIALDGLLVAALSSVETGDLGSALGFAREAAEIARANRWVHWEILSNLVFSRVARFAGAGSLAARILERLHPWVAPSYLPWLNWEAMLAGARLEGMAPTPFDVIPDGPAQLSAAMAYWKSQWLEHRPFVADLQALRELVDPWTPPESTREWATGATTQVPRGLDGIVEGAVVYAARDQPGRRFASAAKPLLDAEIDCSADGKERSAALIAALLLSPGGMTRDQAFEHVFGFEFAPKHAAAIKVLVHRTRKLVGAVGLLRDDGDRLVIERCGTLVVPDARVRTRALGDIADAIALTGRRTRTEILSLTTLPRPQVERLVARLLETGLLRVDVEGEEAYFFDDMERALDFETRASSAAQETSEEDLDAIEVMFDDETQDGIVS